jgi:hypothetical protein
MVDITIDDVTNTGDTGVFDVLMSEVNSQVEAQFLASRITGSDYANVYLGSLQSVMQQSIQFVLQEQMTEAQIEGIAAENLIKTAQLAIAEQELLIKEQELLIRAQELALKTTEANKLRDITEAELEKQWGYEVTRDGAGDLVLGADQLDGRIDKEIEKITADIAIAEEQVIITRSQASKEYVQMLASLDKELGYEYTLDVNDDVVRSSINDIGGGKLDAEIEKMQADVAIAQTSLAIEQARAQASISKEFGFAYTLDIDGNIEVGADQANGKLDKEVEMLQAQIDELQTSTVRSDRQLTDQLLTSDKQRAILLLDEAIKQFQTSSLQPAELAQIQAQTTEIQSGSIRADTQLTDQLLTTDKQRTVIDTEEAIKQFQVDNTLPAELAHLQAQTTEVSLASSRADTQLGDQLLTTDRQRAVIDTEESIKQYQLVNMLPAELGQVQAQTTEIETASTRADTQLSDQLLTADKQRILIDVDTDIKEFQRDNTLLAELSIIEQKITGKKQSTVIPE